MSQASDRWIIYSDESGIHSASKCYGIGLLVVPEDRLDAFNAWFDALRTRYNFTGELKWEKIGNGYGAINLAIEVLKAVLRATHARFVAMLVEKGKYRKWQPGHEETAFYKTFTFLLRDRIRVGGNTTYKVVMDDRSDSYSKQDEVVLKVTNNMAAKMKAEGRLLEVEKGDSKHHAGVQVADILIGALTAAYNAYRNPAVQPVGGKALLVRKMAEVLGWDQLYYDTMPDSRFNVWHFPVETRGPTRTVSPDYAVAPVTPDELKAARGQAT